MKDIEVEAKITESLETLGNYVNRSLSFPVVRYDLRGRTAGQAIGGRTIRLNADLLYGPHRDDMLAQTVPHEVAHIVQFQVYGHNTKHHGEEWKRLMRALGLPPTRCHSYETRPARVVQKYPTYCACPEPCMVTATILRRLENRVYICNRCKTPIRRAK